MAARLLQPRVEGLPASKRLPDFVAVVVKSGECVQQINVTIWVEEFLMLVLPVEVNESQANLLQCGHGRERIIYERTAPATRPDLASNNYVATGFILDSRLHSRQGLACSHEVTTGTPTHERGQRTEDHRLARSGLTGEDGQSRSKLELE